MDIQILLVFILTILTISLVAVCVYVVIILKDFRITLTKVNTLIDNADDLVQNTNDITQTVIAPTAAITGIVTAAMDAFKAVNSVRSIAHNDKQ